MKKVLNMSYMQMIKNAMSIKKQTTGIGGGQRSLASTMRFAIGANLFRKATVGGDPVNGILMIGQTVGRINDIPTVSEVIERTVKEAEQVMAAMNKQFGS